MTLYVALDLFSLQIVNKADKMLAHFVKEIGTNSRGMSGFFISLLFSASLSTVSVALNSLSGVLYMDYVRPLGFVRNTDQNANRIMKIIIFLFGTYAILGGLVIENLDSLFVVLLTISGMFNGVVLGVFSLGMLYPWTNKHVSIYPKPN